MASDQRKLHLTVVARGFDRSHCSQSLISGHCVISASTMHPRTGAKPRQPLAQSLTISSERGSDANGQWHGDDAGDCGQAPSFPARSCHPPETPAPVCRPPCRGFPTGTFTAFQPPQPPWGVIAGDATPDPPEQRTRTWLSASQSPGSSRRATGLRRADPQWQAAETAAERPRGSPCFLIISF